MKTDKQPAKKVRSPAVNVTVKSGGPGLVVILAMALSLVGAWFVYDSSRAFFDRLFGGDWEYGVASNSPLVEDSTPIREIVAMRVRVADILEFKGASSRGTWLVFGDALVTVDAGLVDVNVDEESRVVLVTAPLPVVSQPRIDESKTRIWAIEADDARADKLDEESRIRAQRFVAKQVEAGPYVEQAKERAALILRRLYEEPGYEIAVEWREPAHVTDESGLASALEAR
jgi:hypothetical protein